jgi:hypothetical protein
MQTNSDQPAASAEANDSRTASGKAVVCKEWLAVPPFHVNGADFVIDSTGSTVLACSEETDCPLRFSEREINKDGHFICPNCGRLGQRMIEASPEQCDMTANCD